MAKTKKWEIKKLQKKQSFKRTSQIVLMNRLNTTIKVIKKYLSDSSVENLHSMRIAIRRLRYGMEIFLACFERKFYLMIYDEIVQLQDKSGEVRDIDVLLENINRFKSEKSINNYANIEKEILLKKEVLGSLLELKLLEFVGSDFIKDFKKIFI